MNDLINLYTNAPPAKCLLTRSTDFHWSKLSSWGRGEGFKVVTPPTAASSNNEWIESFTAVYGPSIMMPLTLLSKGIGFGARSIKEKKFSAHLEFTPGFYTAESFFDREHAFVYGTPLIIVEGVLDAEVCSLIYPFVLAMLTSKVSEAQAFILSMLTNTVVMSFDNDEAGNKGTKFGMRNLQKWGIRTADFRPQGVKDWGDLLSLPRDRMQHEMNRYAVELRTMGLVA